MWIHQRNRIKCHKDNSEAVTMKHYMKDDKDQYNRSLIKALLLDTYQIASFWMKIDKEMCVMMSITQAER